QRRAQGFRAVKMNATADMARLDSPRLLDGAVERVRRVQELGLDVAIDFHGRIHKPMARQLAALLEPLRPLFIEEPLLSEQPEAIRQIATQTSIPIALGERLYSRWDFKPFLEGAIIDVAQPDLAHAGGISECRRIAAFAETYDVAIAPHCPLGPIALAACVQLGLATPNFVIQEMSLGIHYNSREHDLLTYLQDPAPFDLEDGMIKTLVAPGLGIAIDEARVRHAAASPHRWRNPAWRGNDGSLREW
ncbi:MAG: galactonate dehydratase, partial [Proteobacteria bacterium]|nr:galactonate dehydratase [Pseudomonadota bacterium]